MAGRREASGHGATLRSYICIVILLWLLGENAIKIIGQWRLFSFLLIILVFFGWFVVFFVCFLELASGSMPPHPEGGPQVDR